MKRFLIPVLLSLFLVQIWFTGCASVPVHPISNDEQNESILKYPVILVHGIAVHDRKSIIDFWGRIPETLSNHGIKVYFGNTDAWGTFESNAEILKTTIDNVLSETMSEKVNLIAHSKGGLDSRFFIWKYDYGDKVASLTTISTPHHGAEIADLIFQQKIIHTKSVRNILKIYGDLYGDINPDLYNVNYQLTTFKMREFNENVIMDERVYYQSVYSIMKNEFDDLIFFNSYLYIKRIRGANDGVVSEASATWSNNNLKLENISHTEIVDYKKHKISGINIPDIYLDIVRDLGKKGF
ncbi:MAG: alpha/beta hydrolase [Treponema sp.]|nr:alpha/beta hydrolase [Treponema sp.]MCL2251821.1 alpha/beta hydrolase [Treponema sp.]